MPSPRYPALFQVNTRVRLAELTDSLGRMATLDDLPDSEFDRLVAVNYADHPSQCYVAMPWRDLGGRTWRLHDLTGPAVHEREGDALGPKGLYIDKPAWGHHVFAFSPAR